MPAHLAVPAGHGKSPFLAAQDAFNSFMGQDSTESFENSSLSVIVEEYRCLDHTVLTKTGAQAKRQSWRMRAVGTGESPNFSRPASWMSPRVSLEVEMDKGVAGVKGAVIGKQVRIKVDGVQVFPGKGDQFTKGDKGCTMWEDFKHTWKFRGLASGIGMLSTTERWMPDDTFLSKAVVGTSALKSTYEVDLDGSRYPAVLTHQRADGSFEIDVFRRDDNGIMEKEHYQRFPESKIFHTGTDRPIEVPECTVTALVSKTPPHDVCLTAGDFAFDALLARVSPKKQTLAAPRIIMDVPRKRGFNGSIGSTIGLVEKETITANVGPEALAHFLSGELRRGRCGSDRLSKWWTLQLGPFAEHKVHIRRHHLSSIFTLAVDDQVLVECAGKDIGCSSDVWHCSFRFIGERQIDFNVFEKGNDGVELDSKGIVVTPFHYEHVVTVSHRTNENISRVQLCIDGVPVEQLTAQGDIDEPELSMTIDELAERYGIVVPDKFVSQGASTAADRPTGVSREDCEVKEWSFGNNETPSGKDCKGALKKDKEFCADGKAGKGCVREVKFEKDVVDRLAKNSNDCHGADVIKKKSVKCGRDYDWEVDGDSDDSSFEGAKKDDARPGIFSKAKKYLPFFRTPPS